MLFTQDAVDGLRDGSITVTFRTWAKPQAKPGGTYRTWGLLLHVDDVARVDPASITNDDARRSGALSADDLRTRLTAAAHWDVRDVWRVEFRCLGPDDRLGRQVAAWTPQLHEDLKRKLARMDQSNRHGSWTHRTLALISMHPGVVSTALASAVQQERPTFKLNVRKLKELGLTQSLEVGYQLTPLGVSYLSALGSHSD
jgi:hypothetical protein